MKHLLLITLFLFTLSSCSKKDPEPEKVNILKGTKWQTPDFVAEIIYGGVCHQVLHFKDNSTFEQYSTRNGSIRKYDAEGTYTLNDKTIQTKSVDADKKETVYTFVLLNSGTFERTPKGRDCKLNCVTS